MMRSTRKTASAWIAACAFGALGASAVCTPAFAQSDATALPAIQHQGSVDYVSGGVGLDESKALRAQASKWPLTMEFIGPGSEYMSDVKVTLTNSKGETVLDTTAQGPYLLARIPPGNYTAHVTHAGQDQSRQFNVAGQGGSRLRFTWMTQK